MTSLEAAMGKFLSAISELATAFTFVEPIVIFRGAKRLAASHPHFAGCLFLNEELIGTKFLAEHFVYELAHQEFFGLNLLDRLVEATADHKLIYAPFQGKERPTIERLKTSHAMYRSGQFYERTQNDAYESNANVLRGTLHTFAPEDLKEMGRFLVRECYKSFLARFLRAKLSLAPKDAVHQFRDLPQSAFLSRG